MVVFEAIYHFFNIVFYCNEGSHISFISQKESDSYNIYHHITSNV